MAKLNFILLFSLVFISADAQDHILTMGGRDIEAEVTDTTGFFIQYDITVRNDKVRHREIHRTEVFSIVYDNGKEHVFYQQDPVLGDDLTVEEMRIYLAGAKDGRYNYNPIWTMVGGVVFSGVISYLSGGGLLLTIAPPIAYMLFQFIPYIKIKESTMSDSSYQYNETYAWGYGESARGRKVLAGLKGGVLGSIIGFVSQLIIKQQ